MDKLTFSQWLEQTAKAIEAFLDKQLPPVSTTPETLHEAMRYAVLGGGKRVRAALVLASGEACQLNATPALYHAAAAVELIHAYSLVHDDLPCMDNDTLRRGRPTCHIQYGESLALLAADALQPLAFEHLALMPIAPIQIVQAIAVLAKAAGSIGMVGGQVIDVCHVDQTLSLPELQQMHAMKTGAMIQASVLLGAIAGGATQEQYQALSRFGEKVGLAFQVVDDILDVTADSQALGKTAGKDADHNKPTYVSLLGLEKSQQLAQQLYDEAILALEPFGDHCQRLKELADFIIHRHY